MRVELRNSWVVAISLFALVPAQLHADATADAKKAVRAAYSKIDSALMKKDVSGMFAMVSPDAIFVDQPQKQSFSVASLKQQLSQNLAYAKSVSTSTKVVSVKLSGSKLEVTSEGSATIVLDIPQAPVQSGKYVQSTMSHDTWVKSHGRWLMKRSTIVAEHTTRNGKS